MQCLSRFVLDLAQQRAVNFHPPGCMIVTASKPATSISCAATTRVEWLDNSAPTSASRPHAHAEYRLAGIAGLMMIGG